jgi:hypothetical protein
MKAEWGEIRMTKRISVIGHEACDFDLLHSAFILLPSAFILLPLPTRHRQPRFHGFSSHDGAAAAAAETGVSGID